MISPEYSNAPLVSSVEILSITGISRATLNNYIKMKIIPRPIVRKPENENLKAKKIGYFPRRVLDIIYTVQRMKKEGRSMEYISKNLSVDNASGQFEIPESNHEYNSRKSDFTENQLKEGESGSHSEEILQLNEGIKLTINDVQCPAFLINNKFEIEWINNEAEEEIFSINVSSIRESSERNIFKLFSRMGYMEGSINNDDLVTYIMKFVRHKFEKNNLMKLYNGIRGKEVDFLERIYDRVEPLFNDSLHETYLNISSCDKGSKSYHAYHIVFREGILCLFSQMDQVFHGIVQLLSSRGRIINELLKQRMPSLVSFSVLVADLQDSSRICAELPPEEYFELIQDIWKSMEGSFNKYYGTYGKHVGDGMVYYFLKDRDDNYIINSIYCALELREKMKILNMEWAVRKGWLNTLYLNIGINEGQEYFGNIPSSPNIEFTALGDSVNFAGRLSDLARYGCIWTTKNVINKLDIEKRKKIKFGVKKGDNEREIFMDNMFSRVMDVINPREPIYSKFMDIATLAVTEVVEAYPVGS